MIIIIILSFITFDDDDDYDVDWEIVKKKKFEP